jgi:hypothetical protein
MTKLNKEPVEIMKGTVYFFDNEAYLAMLGEDMAIKQMKAHHIKDAYTILTFPGMEVVQTGYCNGVEGGKKALYETLGLDYSKSGGKLKAVPENIPPMPFGKAPKLQKRKYVFKNAKTKKDRAKTAQKASKVRGHTLTSLMGPVETIKRIFSDTNPELTALEVSHILSKYKSEGKLISEGQPYTVAQSTLRSLTKQKVLLRTRNNGKTIYTWAGVKLKRNDNG